MKTKKGWRMLALGLIGVMLAGMLTGCSANDETSAEDAMTLSVLVVSPYVEDEKLEEFTAYLEELLPEYAGEGKTIKVQGVSTGDADTDPMGAMAGMTQIAGMMASGECDLMIADPGNAARYARSDTFEPLADLEGLEGYEGREIAYAQVDDEGNETGEMTPACGVDISGHPMLTALVGQEIGAYVTEENPHIEAAVTAINRLVADVE